MLSQKKMVAGLQKIDIPGTVCKECVQCKQTRGSFHRDTDLNDVASLLLWIRMN